MMKPLLASAILLIAAWSSVTLAAISLSITKTPEIPSDLQIKRRHFSASLANNKTCGGYVATVSVGTPAQQLQLILDTGSSDIWLLASSTDICTKGSGCVTPFDTSKSSTYQSAIKNGFDIKYQDGSESKGDYIGDTFKIGGQTIKLLQMGLATTTSVSLGVMGIGYSANEVASATYPTLIEQMVTQNQIPTKAFSLYLDFLSASTGTIIFGGVDTDKYTGNLVSLPIAATSGVYEEFNIALTGFSVTFEQGNTTSITTNNYAQPVILDSGTTMAYLPATDARNLYATIGAVDDTANSGNVYIDCDYVTTNPKMTFNYAFGGQGGISIAVPVTELITSGVSTSNAPNLPFSNVCGFGIHPSSTSGRNLLGDSFLHSAYVVYDLTNNQIALAQTKFGSKTSNVVDFTAGDKTIPSATMASGVAVTPSVKGDKSLGINTVAAGGSALPTLGIAAESLGESGAGMVSVGRGLVVFLSEVVAFGVGGLLLV